MERSILVPFEFSNEANYALEHAYELARISKYPIHMLYVASNTKEVEEWQIELEKVANKFSKEHNNHETIARVRAGNLFNTIYDYGIEINAYLSVMGTHGLRTIDKAMKLIKKFDRMPFILIQRPLHYGEYDKICVPIDSDKKSRAKFLWVKYLSNVFESKVYVIHPDFKDSIRKNNLTSNLNFAGTIFERENADFEIIALDENNYADNLYDYMSEIEPDIVLFMTDKYKKSITNIKRPRNIELSKKIPIMCVNPRTDIQKLGGFSY
ncbi:MAG: universal stress protein [Bacteroidales bacterium]|nr:universal stress protein [Bacteroidales bacterium]MCK9499407.1 universal stress protein [Bacteroidales bacterium]